MEDSCVVDSDTLFTTPFISLLASVVVVAAIFGGIFLSQRQWKPYLYDESLQSQPDTVTTASVPPKIDASVPQHQVPFVVMKDLQWKDIGRALETYEEEVAVLMNGLSRSLEVARESEWDMFIVGMEPAYLLSKQLQQRINRMSPLLEENTRLLQQELLLPFPVTKLLPKEVASNTVSRPIQNTPSPTEPPHRAMKQTMESSAYDSVSQVMAHITRDWTVLGRFVRRRMYDWCRQQIASRLALGDSILVPGAGLGRLAFDLTCHGYMVEANEISLLMASAAHAILHRQVRGTLYPFLMDYFSNEVHSEWRYESVPFPDVDVSSVAREGGSLSYTIGDFVETYAAPHRQHDGIVTCFFLDTATNVYEYLWTIQQVLRVHGVWVHVGPLQWHRNALLHPSADELKGLVETFGFEIVHWSIDLEPIDYRYEDTATARSTKYEAFKPLRMVAIRREPTKSSSLLPRFLQRRQQPASKSKKDTNPVNQILSQVVIEEL